MPEIGAARVITRHTDLTNKEDALGVIDHANNSVTMAKLVQEVQDLINGALQRSGGTMTGQLVIKNVAGLTVINPAETLQFQFSIDEPGNQAMIDLATNDLLISGSAPGGNVKLEDGCTVDGVDVSEHVTASPIDHPDLSIRPAKLDAIDSPADGEAATYDSATGRFEWAAAAAALTLLQAMGTTDVSTTSNTFVDMPDMSLTFELSEAKNVLIIFSASVLIDPINDDDGSRAVAMFKPVIDGSTAVGEGGSQVGLATINNVQLDFFGTPAGFSLMKTLSAGSHTIKVQWKLDQGTNLRCNAGTSYEMIHRRLIVQYL